MLYPLALEPFLFQTNDHTAHTAKCLLFLGEQCSAQLGNCCLSSLHLFCTISLPRVDPEQCMKIINLS